MGSFPDAARSSSGVLFVLAFSVFRGRRWGSRGWQSAAG